MTAIVLRACASVGTLIDRARCRLGRCRRITLRDTADGIGGQCIRCGRVHGWMTSVELRRVPLPWEQS